MDKIQISELIARLNEDELDDEELSRYFIETDVGRTGMAPHFAFNPETVDLDAVEAQGVVPEAAIMGWATAMFNRRWRKKRQKAYEQRIADGYSGPRFVSEGDSWFQYPWKSSDDLIDYITPHYAVYCLSAAGDEFDNMLSTRNRELIADAIRNTEAQGLLFSGGGNDIAGPELVGFLHAPDGANSPSDFIAESFTQKLSQMERAYRDFFENLWAEFPKLKIFYHGYDHAIPRDDGKWIGGPLARLGTIDQSFWAPIVAEMIDRYNALLSDLSARYQGRLFHADCRQTVGPTENWRDELHAKSAGCKAAAAKFLEQIQSEFDGLAPESHLAAPEVGGLEEKTSDVAGPSPDKSDEYGDLESENAVLPDSPAALDESLDPVPESFAEMAVLETTVIPQVSWPRHDANAPDYAHFTPPARGASFTLTPEVLERLIELNHFAPVTDDDRLVFALRGARLVNGHQAEGSTIEVVDQRPNHATPRCLVGVYDRSAGSILALTGSTVPTGKYMIKHWKRVNGVNPRASRANLLPTGCYRYRRGSHGWSSSHSRWKVPVALRLTDPGGGRDGSATVLRSNNDATYGTLDEYDLSMPHDNIHCAYGTTSFSSAGCLTIRGSNTAFAKRGSLQWNRFQDFILSMDRGAPVDCVLLTGAEAALVARSDGQDLRRLRTGSQGEAVRRLQAFLGLVQDGDFGPKTKQRLAKWQSTASAGGACGVYAPSDDNTAGRPILGAA